MKPSQELEHVYTNAEEVSTMLITALEKERKELYQKGLEKGIEEGRTMLITALEKERKELYQKGLEKGIEEGKI